MPASAAVRPTILSSTKNTPIAEKPLITWQNHINAECGAISASNPEDPVREYKPR